MKLIVIYGPAASGKYTVGKKLAESTGYKFFYNHITVDVVRVLFDDDYDPRRFKLLDNLRVAVIEYAAQYNIDIIFTIAYTPDLGDGTYLPTIIDTVTRHGGTVHFVRLNPPDSTLYERIGSPSRGPLGKPTKPEQLRHQLENYNMRATIDYPSHITLDTSKLTPEESARRIITEFKLPNKDGKIEK